MKRISIQIRSKKNPDEVMTGYVLLHELGAGLFSFFSTKKYNQEELLEVTGSLDGQTEVFQLKLAHCHEQISSGRVMTDIPQEGQPFPTRTFYRCFAKRLQPAALSVVPDAPVSDIAPVADISVAEVTPPVEEAKAAA